ncbi:SGNH/GDSL hydrolase family protein [Streptomyces sp. VRA16 Mangrove soil]|uniref:SGNH/GDSL hydrolase family protein n=1 Tax=Streptomyces sp. VRA16 Mangrove soil TaxID=2817434 RepID=UPI001A9DFC66|nr:SGNH/GDSL hydrolase family protein [Streptomyces sp. VRA16 Mangrove soil]MBO1331210.1 SGNH/GDSL hydrolase family protein [Streptomyces sp. VRA16 Mangrove soil]
MAHLSRHAHRRREPAVRRRTWGTAVLLAVCAGLAPGTVAQAAPDRPEPLPLERLFDNRAVSDDATPGEADFDGAGGSLSAQDLAAAGWTPGRGLGVDGARLTWPRSAATGPDNVRADGQRVRVTGRGDALAFLVAGTGGDAEGAGVVRYADGSRSSYTLTAPDWRTGPLATKSVALPHRNTPDGQLTEKTRLFVVSVPVRAGQRITSVELPRAGSGSSAALHVFAVSVRPRTSGWTGTWSASPAGYRAVGPWADRTVRLVVHTSAGGPRTRIRLENTFASTPVRIGSASVAVQEAGAAARGNPVPLTFRGESGVQLPAGAQAFSDPVDLDVPADGNLLVSFHLPDPVVAAPVHSQALQRSYVSGPGDHAAEAAGTAYTSTISYWPLLTGVDVGGGPGSVVLLGDSITDGVKSTQDANHRWPNVLARRLLGQSDVPRYGVLNEGISANKIVTDRYTGDGISTDTGGVSALHRLDRDVLAQTSARTVVVFQGINDLRWGGTAEQVTAGLREIVRRTHARGLKVIGATITPCEGEALCPASVDAQRVAVNDWLRGPDSPFDGLVDFDTVVRDPAHPARMLPAYDSGDHLHPGDAGLKAMADAVDLRLLKP